MAPGPYAIGIDLGTANTCVAVYRDGDIEIVPHDGCRTMPSYVAFTESVRLIGASAKNQAAMNPQNTIFNIMRLVGRKFSDSEVQSNLKQFPFVVLDKGGKPVISVEYKRRIKVLTPEEVLSMILARAKENAESYLGSTVDSAVLTVPALFNSSQRQSIRDAALVSGLEVLFMVNGPTAAAIDYTISNWRTGERNLLFVDLGAGTLNVALVTIEEGIIEVKAVRGHTCLGGEDLDTRLINHLTHMIKRRWSMDITSNDRARLRLRTACERAKCELSSQQQTTVQIDSFLEGIDFNYILTSTIIEENCADIFRIVMAWTQDVLGVSKMDKSSLHEVVVIGGSSRIPKIQKLLSDRLLNGKEISKSLNLDEAAARGAAIHAAMHSGYIAPPSRLRELLLLDVAPNSLGIQTAEGVMTTLIERSTTIPTRKSEIFSTCEDNQAYFHMSAFEGNDWLHRPNIPLGTFSIPLPPAPRGVPQIEVTFDCDQHGRLSVQALLKDTGQQRMQRFEDFARLSPDSIERMKREAEQYKADDEAEADRVSARNALESYAYSLKSDVRDSRREGSEILRVTSFVDTALAWLDENQSASASEYRVTHTELEKVSASIATESPDTDTTKIDSPDDVSLRSHAEAGAAPQLVKFSEAEWLKVGKESSWDSYPQKKPLPSYEKGKDRILDLSRDLPSPGRISGKVDPQLQGPAREPSSTAKAAAPSPPDFARPPPRSSSSSPILEAETKTSNTPRSDTPRSSEKGLGNLFPTSGGEDRTAYTDAEFSQISTYLRNAGRSSWSTVPRLYTVLRLIGHLPFLDSFVDQGITDIWFPFTPTSLPDALTPSARANFLQTQSVVLSKSLRFEKSSDRRHAHFSQDEPLPFEVIGRLGSGGHGYVDKVMSTVSHREYARKLFRRTRGVSKEDIKSFQTELQILKRVSHIHCVELVQSYTDPRYFALIMSPVADCNLFEYYSLASNSANKLSLLRSFFGCLANTLQYIHDMKIRHRDIKPQNVLVKGDRVLLTDFGIALDWEHLSRSTTTADSGKTWLYAAPEVARYEKRNTSSDIWSLGCVFLEMITVLKGESVVNMRNFFNERKENYRFYANIAYIPEWIDKLRGRGLPTDDKPLEWVAQMLQETPDLRPTAAKLVNDVTAVSAATHVPFCGPCCRDDDELSEADNDDEELWGYEGEPTSRAPLDKQ